MSADLNKMATSFNCTVRSLEDELTQLILDGQISARIDSGKKVSCNTLPFFLKKTKKNVFALNFET